MGGGPLTLDRVKRFWKAIAGRLRRIGRHPGPAVPVPVHSATVHSATVPATTVTEPTPATIPAPRRPARRRAVPRHLAYTPDLDGRADPGEVVWMWVAYEDDPTRGKDRPVLVVGREGNQLLGLMLSSRSDRGEQRNWLALGAGAWDHADRPSWVRLDRVLSMPEDGIRREGAVLDPDRFEAVAQALLDYGWTWGPHGDAHRVVHPSTG